MKRLASIVLIVAACVCASASVGGWKLVVSPNWSGLTNGKQAIACFSDRPGLFSIGYYRNIKGVMYPVAASIDKRGVYLQTVNQRGMPNVSSYRWD